MSAANGRGFFYGTDSEVYTASALFLAKILAEAGAFGLDEAAALRYQTAQQIYAAAYLAAINPDTRTNSRVRAKNDAKNQLRVVSAQLARVISGQPFVTDKQKIDLGLNVRKAPTPARKPETPGQFTVELGTIGELRLKWKNRNATGCVYNVRRRLNGTGEFVFVGQAGKKRFVDQTIPAGTSKVQYQVQAVRSTSASDWGIFELNFGGVPMMGFATAQLKANLAA